MDRYDVVIIGCGAAGMMAGITCAQKGKKVVILEKNEKAGKKLFITGKGRCNLTNACEDEQLFRNIVTNSKFMYSAISGFNTTDTMDFFKSLGLDIKTERGGRVFPESDHSSDVISVLTTKLKRLGVEVRYNSVVKCINVRELPEELKEKKQTRVVSSIEVCHKEKSYVLEAEKIVVATGGLSYPRTGSTGDGYEFAKSLGLKVVEPKPALVPLTTEGIDCKSLMGLSLKNVTATFVATVKGKQKVVYSEFGEMLFTHFGVSGPLILSASSFLHKYDGCDIKLVIDLKPALSEKELDDRVLRDFSQNMNKQFRNSIDSLLPKKLVPVIIERSGIDPYKKVNEISKQQRATLVKCLKEFEVTITGYRGFDEAIITQGGVSVKELSPQTMEAKTIKGLYFVGEVVDCDALTGGYNLQLAWSMARSIG